MHVPAQYFLDYTRFMRPFERNSYPLNISANTLPGYRITPAISAAYFVLLVGVWPGVKFLSIRVTQPADQST